MPKFIIIEERIDTYSATIEADNVEHAQKLWNEDSEEIFSNNWEQEETVSVELRQIYELNDKGENKTAYIFENGAIMDTVDLEK